MERSTDLGIVSESGCRRIGWRQHRDLGRGHESARFKVHVLSVDIGVPGKFGMQVRKGVGCSCPSCIIKLATQLGVEGCREKNFAIGKLVGVLRGNTPLEVIVEVIDDAELSST